MELYKDVTKEAQYLVNTSADDMKSGLYFYQANNPIHVAIIERGLKICKSRGEKTKAKLLESKLKKMKQEPVKVDVKPKRIQRKRTRGCEMPENTVYVGRPTIFGNPYKVVNWGDGWHVVTSDNHLHLDHGKSETKLEAAENAVRYFRELASSKHRKYLLDLLKGKNLACWCKEGDPCHADVLLELANKSGKQK